MNRTESYTGTINALLLLLFLTGGVMMLLFGKDLAFSLTLQPLLMLAFGSASCLEAQEILRGTEAGKTAMRLLLLFLLVASGFVLSGRGLFNALLLIRAVRSDPGVLGRSVKHTCVPVIFGIAVLFLLCRVLRFS